MSYRFLISGNSSARSSSSSTSGTNCIDTNSCNMINPSSTLTAARVMDRPSAQEHQAALKCPRCDSTNTKFCYYNNYSLWQPRHFCKACKRYWTRGGMVRNVPVGGACRKKNKRVRKPTATAKASPHDPPPPCSLALPDPLKLLSSMTSSSYNTETSSMLYSSTTLPNAIQVPSCTPAFDLELQASALGAGILSNQRDDEYGLDQFSQQLPLMNDHPQFGSSLSSASAASLLVSSPQRPKEIEANQVLLAHEDLYDLETNGINNCDIEWQIPRDYSLESFGSAATEISPIDSSYLFFKEAAIGWPDAAANRWSSAAHLI